MKFRTIIFIIISLIAVVSGIYAQPALAQSTNEPTGFKNVTLWVYPEYDDPRLLVMLEGKITGVDASTKPLVRFLVPQTAVMYSAGSKDAQGVYTGGPPARKASSIPGWDEISYNMTSDTFRVEYYADMITGSPDKKIAFDFRWLYPISDLQVIIQKPTTATNFTVTPSGTQSVEGGFNVLTYSKTNLTLDPGAQPLHFDISYTKTDPNPSINNAASPTSSSSSNLIPIIFIGVAAAVIVGFILLFLFRRNSGQPARYAARAGGKPQPRSSRAAKQSNAVHGDKFCNQCGKPVDKNNKFCPNCGNTLG